VEMDRTQVGEDFIGLSLADLVLVMCFIKGTF
jgi:hypothetical protein